MSSDSGKRKRQGDEELIEQVTLMVTGVTN
jgi:hypothetical protein